MTPEKQLAFSAKINAEIPNIIPAELEKKLVRAYASNVPINADKKSIRIILKSLHPAYDTLTSKGLIKHTILNQMVYIHWSGEDGPKHAVFIIQEEETKGEVQLVHMPDGTIHLVYEMEMIKAFHLSMVILDFRTCSFCGADKSYKKCARCELATCRTRYCSKECQIAHWPKHKKYCGKH